MPEKRGWRFVSVNTAYKNTVLGFISHRWGMKPWANSILIAPALAQLFSQTRCSQPPQCCHHISNSSLWWRFQLRVPLCITPGTPEVVSCNQVFWSEAPHAWTEVFRYQWHVYLGHRFICNTELLLRLASPSNFSNYSVSSSTEQLEPVPLVLNLVCYLIQLHFALISWQLFSHLRTETD